ncbi:GntR family transcriptional regulator [Micromonospora sp. NPDC047738]|uniref:GntR family transcriptional regulator n=1 Tax=unclassified Micromonospora TaxID=2617518 RepID=UPI0033D14214
MAAAAIEAPAGVSHPAIAEPGLAEAYGVHMNTASRALSLLHDRELIIGHPGRGTYVAERPGQ